MNVASSITNPSPESALRWLTERETTVQALRPVAASTPAGGAAEADAPQRVEAAVEVISDFVSARERDLRFRVDEGSGRTVITVLDAKTDDVIRQIPGEEVLALAKRIAESNGEPGLLVRGEA